MARTSGRPLSPHLQIYRWQITMALSILHRITGVGLAVAALVLTYWLTAAAYGPEAFATAQAVMGSWFGQLVLIGFTVALYYHLANGIRHLAWDMGLGFELTNLRASGWLVVAFTAVMTAATWACVWFFGGGA